MSRTLMIVGTASYVGKTVLATALCRILHEDGIRVAPFKSQNMALNSFVCSDGSEIGRAQVVQAEAAGLEPEADMNPILLKPTLHRKMQVVLHGRVYGSMSADEYYAEKSFFFEQALASYRRLADRFDVILIEGAGSTAEINLRERDIVNLPFAAAVEAPALLVGDIDRGGVFASIVGTFALLREQESKLLRGFIINKLRGDAGLLDNGPRLLEERTGWPCFGIVPYIDSLRIDQEDSVSLEERRVRPSLFRVGVVRLPHISNDTDFNPLESFEGVSVDFLEKPCMPFPDLLVIPGTKNTIQDLEWLIERGFRDYIAQALEGRTFVLGICGGYQMLGRMIADPHGVEEGRTVSALGLLPVETELERTKVTTRSGGQSFIGARIEGYEIHMGRTHRLEDVPAFCQKTDGGSDGVILGSVAGTYFHGLFESADFAPRFLSMIAERRGLEWRPKAFEYSKEAEYGRLAAIVRKHLAMDKVYDLLGVSGKE